MEEEDTSLAIELGKTMKDVEEAHRHGLEEFDEEERKMQSELVGSVPSGSQFSSLSTLRSASSSQYSLTTSSQLSIPHQEHFSVL